MWICWNFTEHVKQMRNNWCQNSRVHWQKYYWLSNLLVPTTAKNCWGSHGSHFSLSVALINEAKKNGKFYFLGGGGVNAKNHVIEISEVTPPPKKILIYVLDKLKDLCMKIISTKSNIMTVNFLNIFKSNPVFLDPMASKMLEKQFCYTNIVIINTVCISYYV
jgi:hypothetical protein